MISAQDFKRALARLAGAVNVITTCDEQGQTWGFTATAFCSLSLEPPLVLFCLSQDAECYQAFLRASVFAVNMLSERQRELAQRFATKGRAKYRKTAFAGGTLGPPLLPGSLVTLECSVQNIYPGGDHGIITGLVEHVELPATGQAARPLLYYEQTYGTFAGLPVKTTQQNLNGRKEKKV